MLHAVPELLDALEARLISGQDPAPLLSSIRWSELVGWPANAEDAMALKRRIQSIQTLVAGLQAPLRAALVSLSAAESDYSRQGVPAELPILAPRVRETA